MVNEAGCFYSWLSLLKGKINYVYLVIKLKNMKKFIVIDYTTDFSCMYESESEMMENCGYDINEMSFEEFLEEVKGEYEVIEVEGNMRWLQED